MKEIVHKNTCFFNTTSFWGGGEKWHTETALMQAEKGINTFFVAQKKSVISQKINNTSIHSFYISTSTFSFLNPFKIKKLISFFKENKIDILIFNSPSDLKLGGIAAFFAHVPTVVYRRGIAVEVKKNFLTSWLFKKVVTHFIFNSEVTKKLLTKNFNFIESTKKTALIYNAISFPTNIKPKITTPNSPFLIGNAGRLVAQKGQYFLIKIAKRLKEKQVDFKIVVAGEGALLETLQEKINQNNLQNEIELLGFVSDMNAFMQSIDVFVSTAKWEGFGFVLAEAMTHKKPTIAFDLSSNPELIVNEKTGFLIPPFDVDAFAEKLSYLAKNKEKRDEIGEKAYFFAKENFEKQKQFEKFLAFVTS